MSVDRFREHLVTLHTKGEHKLAYSLKGKVNIAAFTRALRDKVSYDYKGKQAPEYSYMWFATEDGVMFYASGSDEALTIIDSVAANTAANRKVEVECKYRGKSKDLFLLKIARDLPEFKPRKGKHSFGGKA